MKKILGSVLAFAVVLGAAFCAKAEDEAGAEMKPVAVISFSGYAELKRDLEYLGTASENPDMVNQVEALLTLFTQGQGLAGLDQDKPWGAAAALPEGGFGQPNVIAFVPVSDLQKLLGALAQLTGEPVDKGDGVLEIKQNAGSVFVKEHEGWAFVAQSAEGLGKLPADPMKLLGGLNERYDLALQVNIQNIPQQIRDFAIDAMKQQVERGLQQAEQNDDDDDEPINLQPQIARHQIEQLAKVINELDALSLGWSIDSEGKRVLIDLNVTALDGSETAKQLSTVASGASKFAGFLLPEAMLTAHVNTAAERSDIENSLTVLSQLRTHIMNSIDEDEDLSSQDAKDQVKELVGEALDSAEATVKNGRFNLGAAIVGEGPLTIAAGGLVVDGEKIEEAAKKFAKLAENEPDAPEIKLDVDEHKGVKFHTMSVPLPDDDDSEKARQLFGEVALVTLGFGPEACYIALGDAGVETIKSVMDKSAESASDELPPVQISLALAPLFKLAAQQDDADPNVALMAESLKESGSDHLRITVRPIENGVKYELEGEEGIIKMIGAIAKLAQAAGGAGGVE